MIVKFSQRHFIIASKAMFELSGIIEDDPRVGSAAPMPFLTGTRIYRSREIGQALFDEGGEDLLDLVIAALRSRHGPVAGQLKVLWDDNLHKPKRGRQ